MAVASALGLPERHLITELAVGIARRLGLILPPADHEGSAYRSHLYSSHFETGCSVLWTLGVARAAYGSKPEQQELTYPTDYPDRIFPPFFRFSSPSEIRDVMAGAPPASPPSLDNVLPAYIQLASDYGPDEGPWLSTRREPFIPSAEFDREIDALERLGYIERLGFEVRWTDKMAPTMQKAYLWQPDGRSSAEVAEAELEAVCAALIELTPEHTKLLLARDAKRLSEFDFWLLLRDRFDGLCVSRNPDGTPRRFDIIVVRGVYQLLRSL